MNIKDLHEKIKIEGINLYNVFKYIIDEADKNTEYKLFNSYLFRTDCMYDSIKGGSYPFYEENQNYIVDGRINYRNKAVKRYIKDNSSLYIGNVYYPKYGYRPIFISYRIENGEMVINGYSINAGIDSDKYFFNKNTTKKLKKLSLKELDVKISFASSDLKDSFDKMIKRNIENIGK